MEENINNCFRPWMEYLISDFCTLPETANWEGTLWQEILDCAHRNEFGFIVGCDGIIYKVVNEGCVKNVSKTMTIGEIQAFGCNSLMRPIFRLAWITNNLDQYIQYFSPVGHGIEIFSILDGFGPDGRTTLPLKPFLMLKTTDDMFVPYTLTHEDYMATDWVIHGHTLEETRDDIGVEEHI